jgi:DNA-binding transcriptional LysR family regulator
MDAFHVRYSPLRLELIISDRCLDLSEGEADIAIRAGEPQDENLVRLKIADVPWAVYASKSYIDRHGAPACPDDIRRHFIVMCNCGSREGVAERWLRSVAPHATVVARCDTGSEQLRAVKSGAGLALLLAHQRTGDLIRVIDDIGIVTPFYLLLHRDLQRTPRVQPFADFVTTEIKAFRALLSG